jgi:formylglycine-generating enzyme required for sulfatase activity
MLRINAQLIAVLVLACAFTSAGQPPELVERQERDAAEREPARTGGEARERSSSSGRLFQQRFGIQPIEFVPIAPGTFWMGCSSGDSQCDSDEMPRHQVRITKGFELGKYEVTQAQWEAVMGANPSEMRDPELPVETVSWEDVQAFFGRLNTLDDGYRYRLPTEAEWEYAARAGTNDPSVANLDAVGWSRDNSDKRSRPVGQKLPNAWGLYDMQGNVWEWCADWFDVEYYRTAAPVDPPGPSNGTHRVVRGGGWYSGSRYCRVSVRGWVSPGDRGSFDGFRCGREVR